MRTCAIRQSGRDNSGVALIIVLGMLAVLTILAVAFAVAMRVEWWAARNNANSVRAEGLLHVGIQRAMADVDRTMTGKCYPAWTNRPTAKYDAMCSDTNTGAPMPGILSGEALRVIPSSLINDAAAAATSCYWTNVVVNGKAVGRIAYLVANVSGMIDPNWACDGRIRDFSTNLFEIWPSNMLTSAGTNTFVTNRAAHKRYETVPEFTNLNNAVKRDNMCFFPYSYDVGRDMYFTNKSELGTRTAGLLNKFNINSIAGYPGYTQPWNLSGYYTDASFMANYFAPLTNILGTLRTVAFYASIDPMVERQDDVAWNIVNWLDTDRIPQGSSDYPWRHTEGGEAIPLINEIVLRPCTNIPAAAVAAGASNWYEFVVEMWYPFAPAVVTATDNFSLAICVYTNCWQPTAGVPADTSPLHMPTATAPPSTGAGNIIERCYKPWSTNVAIGPMAFATTNEFRLYKTPMISFPEPVATNPAVTNWLEIGAVGANGIKRQVWFLARTSKADFNTLSGVMVTNPVDEAMGYSRSSATEGEQGEADGASTKRKLKNFTSCMGHSVCDPRSNGQIKYWTQAGDGTRNMVGIEYTPGPLSGYETLGSTNANFIVNNSVSGLGVFAGSVPAYCLAPTLPAACFQGTPIYAKNGPMRNIGELGNIYRSNLDGEMIAIGLPPSDGFWRTINLLHYDEGASLLDLCTVRSSNAPCQGLAAISTQQTNALLALLCNIDIGPTSMARRVALSDLNFLAATIISNGPYISFQDLFRRSICNPPGGAASDLAYPTSFASGGPVAEAIRKCAANMTPTRKEDFFLEDTLRKFCELISFRQNIFVIIVASQTLGPDQQTVMAEKRAAATVYRDSYTGKYFIRSLKWLSDR